MLAQADSRHTKTPILWFAEYQPLSEVIWDTPLGRRLSSCLPSPENGSRVNHVSKVPVSCSQAHNHYSLESQGSLSIYFDLSVKLCSRLTGKLFLGLHMLWVRWKLSNVMRIWHEPPEGYFLKMWKGAAASLWSTCLGLSICQREERIVHYQGGG